MEGQFHSSDLEFARQPALVGEVIRLPLPDHWPLCGFSIVWLLVDPAKRSGSLALTSHFSLAEIKVIMMGDLQVATAAVSIWSLW